MYSSAVALHCVVGVYVLNFVELVKVPSQSVQKQQQKEEDIADHHLLQNIHLLHRRVILLEALAKTTTTIQVKVLATFTMIKTFFILFFFQTTFSLIFHLFCFFVYLCRDGV